MAPSGAPTRPSALSGPCHTSFHLAPAAMTPGISVTVTSRAAAGCGKFCSPPALRCCATAVSLRARADPRKQQAIAHIAFNFINPPSGVAREPGKTGIPVCSGPAAVYTGAAAIMQMNYTNTHAIFVYGVLSLWSPQREDALRHRHGGQIFRKASQGRATTI